MHRRSHARRSDDSYTPPPQDWQRWKTLGGCWVAFNSVPYLFTAAATPDGCMRHLDTALRAGRALVNPMLETKPLFLTPEAIDRERRAQQEQQDEIAQATAEASAQRAIRTKEQA